jgi:ferredoxin
MTTNVQFACQGADAPVKRHPVGRGAARLLTAIDELAPENSEVIDVAKRRKRSKRSKRRLQVNTSRDLAVPPVELKVRVNRQRCQGHARCAALAPELFEADEFGEAHEIGDGRVSADLHDKAYLAKANCPESAIDIEER